MRTVRLNETALRNVIRKIMSEQIVTPMYYKDAEGQDQDFSDIEADIEMTAMEMVPRPPRSEAAALKLVQRAAIQLGYDNLPIDFLRTVAIRLTDV